VARGDGGVYKRGKRYWIWYYAHGKLAREGGGLDGKGTEDEKEARRKLKRRISELRGDRYFGPKAEKLTVDDLLDDYVAALKLKGAKSVKIVEIQLKPIRDTFAFVRALDVTPDRIREFSKTRLAEELAPPTVNRSIACMRAAFRLAFHEGRLPKCPHFPTLDESGHVRQGFFERAEIDLVVAHLNEPVDDVVLFLYYSGWRKSEALGLRWEDVDRGAAVVTLKDSKNREPRTLPLHGDLKKLIERRWKTREFKDKTGTTAISPHVFHRGGEPVRDFRRAWTLACTKSKVPDRLVHDLRRTAVRDLIRAGTPETVAMRLTGHRTRSILDRYDITNSADKIDALKRLEAYRSTRPAVSNVANFEAKK
jgi:integrase